MDAYKTDLQTLWVWLIPSAMALRALLFAISRDRDERNAEKAGIGDDSHHLNLGAGWRAGVRGSRAGTRQRL